MKYDLDNFHEETPSYEATINDCTIKKKLLEISVLVLEAFVRANWEAL